MSFDPQSNFYELYFIPDYENTTLTHQSEDDIMDSSMAFHTRSHLSVSGMMKDIKIDIALHIQRTRELYLKEVDNESSANDQLLEQAFMQSHPYIQRLLAINDKDIERLSKFVESENSETTFHVVNNIAFQLYKDSVAHLDENVEIRQ